MTPSTKLMLLLLLLPSNIKPLLLIAAFDLL